MLSHSTPPVRPKAHRRVCDLTLIIFTAAPPPVVRIREKVRPRCLHWYITSAGQKIAEFEPRELGSVVWEDANGKEVLHAYLGQTCDPEGGEQPILWAGDRPGKVVLNKKLSQS